MSGSKNVQVVNAGTSYRIQEHKFTNTGSGFPTFDVEFFKAPNGVYKQSGITTTVGLTNNEPKKAVSVYGGAPILTEYIAINHVGTFVPTVSGQYTFSAPAGVDDIVLMWLGNESYAGRYTRDNAEYEATYGDKNRPYKVDLDKGRQYPFRILMANAQGNAVLGLTYTGPGNLTGML